MQVDTHNNASTGSEGSGATTLHEQPDVSVMRQQHSRFSNSCASPPLLRNYCC
jgi:hypothetical protein